jgi:hypothetical protein
LNTHATLAEQHQYFIGHVYAPFIFKKLPKGTLDVEKRSVNLSIKGNDFIIYNEQTSNSIEFDPNPLFKKTTIDMYGCMWNFNIWSSKSLRTQNQSSQALIILVRGIFIDT